MFRADKTAVSKSNDTKDSTTKAMKAIVVIAVAPIGYHLLGLAAMSDRLYCILGFLAAVTMVFACGLRWTAMKLLGPSFSRTLKGVEGGLVTHGPYAIVRHPGYLSNLLIYISYSLLVSASLIVPAFVTALFLWIWGERIALEEELISQTLQNGEYEAYRKRTPWRLVPYIY